MKLKFDYLETGEIAFRGPFCRICIVKRLRSVCFATKFTLVFLLKMRSAAFGLLVSPEEQQDQVARWSRFIFVQNVLWFDVLSAVVVWSFIPL